MTLRSEPGAMSPLLIEDWMQARGIRLAKDDCAAVLRDGGAMSLPGWVILMLMRKIEAYEEALSRVPADWAMSHAELCSIGIV